MRKGSTRTRQSSSKTTYNPTCNRPCQSWNGQVAVPNKQNAAELQRIIKETTGLEVTLLEVYKIWYYFQKVLLCSGLWRGRGERPPQTDQLSLFAENANEL